MPANNHALTEAESSAVDHVSRAFRAGVPILRLLDDASARYGPAAWHREHAQQALLNGTIFFLPKSSPPDFSFGTKRKARFLRALLDEVDHIHGAAVDEALIEAAATACQMRDTNECEEGLVYVVLNMPSYNYDDSCIVSNEVVLAVSKLFSDVGLRLWEAGLYMYALLVNPESKIRADVTGRRVLELGAGTGLCASAFLEAKAAHVVLSDYQEQVLENLSRNVQWNIPPNRKSALQIELLDVFDTESLKRFLDDSKIDTLFAADVTYDPFLLDAVVRAFQVAVSGNRRVGYLLATRRNHATDSSLDAALASSGICVEEVNDENRMASMVYFPDYDFSQVRVFRLSANPC